MRIESEVRLSPAELARRLGLPRPTPEQEAIIAAAPDRSHVIVAGAGSGKTETMAARVVWLVANGFVLPEEILGLTFTRKAAGELSERVIRRLRGLRSAGLLEADDLGASPTIATYHSFAASLVADFGLRVGVEPGTRLLGEAAAWQLVYDLVERWDPQQHNLFSSDDEVGRSLAAEDLRSLDRAVDTLVQAVLSLAGQCAEHLVTPQQLGTTIRELEARLTCLPRTGVGGAPSEPAPSKNTGKALASIRARRALVPVLHRYLARKRELEVMDFGDQVVVASQLARLPEVAEGQRARFRVVLLDEFQDTSHAQLELLARLFGDGHPVTAVGDPYQSIYGWRGASAGNLASFRRRFAGRGPSGRVQIHGLTTSWRNPHSALAVANVIAAPLRARDGVGEAARTQVARLSAAPAAPAGEVAVGWHETHLDEAVWVADQVAARWRPGAGTAAVVCRQRSQFPAIESALRARGLPVEVVGLGGLLQRPEVADAVAVLQVLADPTRSDALMRLLSGPRWQLGPRDLFAFGAWARELGRPLAGQSQPGGAGPGPQSRHPAADPDGLATVSLIDALGQLPPPEWVGPSGYGISAAARQRLQRLGSELARLRRRIALPLVDLVVEVERTLLVEIELSVAGEQAGAAAVRSQLDEFLDVAAGFSDVSGRPTLPAFVAWLAAAAERERGLEQAGDEREQERPRDGVAEHVDPSTTVVQVLTVHAAKGLEWDVVAVPGLIEGRFPAGRKGQGRDTASGWPTTLDDIPYPLRGDVAALPQWRLSLARNHAELEEALTEFRFEVGAHEAAEERRLAYVAVTRTRGALLLSGFVWDADRTKPREPSRFLREVLDATRDARESLLADARIGPAAADPAVLAAIDDSAAATIDDPPAEQNPLQQNVTSVEWPLPSRMEPQLRAAGDLILRMAQTAGPAKSPVTPPPRPGPSSPADLGRAAAGQPPGPVADELRRLRDEADRLLAERVAERRPVSQVRVPSSLSASRAVRLAADRDRFALDLRRPMPVEPRASTRRGTSFHEWIERRLHSQALIDLADLPGAGDADLPVDEDLEALKLTFESSQWATRQVLDTEVDIETVVAGVVLRGRIDAIFAAPESARPVRLDLVDWKTGPRPRGADARAAQVQLAVYRVALARLRELPTEAVRASFFYLATGQTITPATDLDEATLEGLIARSFDA